MMRRLLTMAVLALGWCGAAAQVAIGHWRDWIDYSQVRHVEPAGDRVYAASEGGLFYFDLDDHTVNRLQKLAPLNDVGIATMAYDGQTKCLVVAYTNSNIDILHDDVAHNLSDIKRSGIQGNTAVNNIRVHDRMAYLCCGFGVVVVDLRRYEIKETYYLGTGGMSIDVYDLAFAGDSIYAATEEGLKRASASEPYLTISDRWEYDGRLAGRTVTRLEVCDSALLAAAYDDTPDTLTLYRLAGGGAQAWCHGAIHSMRVACGQVIITRDESVVRYGCDLQRVDSVARYTWSSLRAHDATLTADGSLWVGHAWDGMIRLLPTGGDYSLKPDGPFSHDKAYRLVPFNYRMMLCPGGHKGDFTPTWTTANLLTYDGRSWSMMDYSNPLAASCADVVDVAVNPVDTTEVVIALWGHGVMSLRNGVPQVLYDETNTGGALRPYQVGDYSSLRAGALAFDSKGNLWVTCSHQPQPLAVRYADGTWKGFSTEGMTPMVPYIDKLIWDSITDYKWFTGESSAIYVHDGASRMAKVDPNNGSKLATETVTALVQDHDGNIWVGTNKGLKVIYDGYKAFNNGGNGELSPVTCSNITLSNGDFAEYLMAYESVTSIAVDGANRKWVGTATGGLYLISANGLEQLQHFTTSNSPLFSDKVICLGVQPRTGEVYVGTDKGLQVYRGTATYATTTPMEHIYAFPNPVRPGYEGPIAIKGFTRNGLVHITDAAGHTVYATTAEGGQVVWNGCTQSGEKVGSGVYYVFAADAEGGNRSVAKILIVR